MEIQPFRTTSTRMTRLECEALFAYRDSFKQTIDPVLIANELYRNGCISEELRQIIYVKFNIGTPIKDLSDTLINNLPFHTNLLTVVRVLDKCGYHSLASKLFLCFLKRHTRVQEVQKSPRSDRKELHAFFRKLKIMIHDAQFKDPRTGLRDLAKRFMKQFNDETDPHKKQRTADKLVAILGAEIDAHAITFDSSLPNTEMFDEMKSLVPYTENTMITDVVYYGRLANANAIALNFDNGENMLREARVRAFNTGPCLELVNMLYIEVYFLLWRFEQTPTCEIRDSLMMWGRIGLESLEDEEYGTKLMWRRMFIQRMVFCLLGIGNRANIIPGADVNEHCLSMAEDLLADFDRYNDNIEQRRQMFYFVARARLYQCRGDLETADLYVTRAERLAKSGNFKEIEFISQLRRIIEDGVRCGTEAQHTEDSFNTGSDSYSDLPSNSNSRLAESPLYMHSIHAHSNSGSSTTVSRHIAIGGADTVLKDVSQNMINVEPIERDMSDIKQSFTADDETQMKVAYSEIDNTVVKEPFPANDLSLLKGDDKDSGETDIKQRFTTSVETQVKIGYTEIEGENTVPKELQTLTLAELKNIETNDINQSLTPTDETHVHIGFTEKESEETLLKQFYPVNEESEKKSDK